MARKLVMVTCRFCKEKIPKDEAYCVKHGKQNYFYCSFEHSISKSPRDLFYDVAFDVFGRTTHTVFFKELDEIAKVHGFQKMKAYLEDNKYDIERFMSKGFSSEYGRCRYFSAILKNNLGDYVMKEEPVVKKEINIDMDITPSNYKPKEQRKGLDELMNSLLEEEYDE